jgi:hypothetical protein
MRRPSIVVLITVVIGAMVTWTAAIVFAQPSSHHKPTRTKASEDPAQAQSYLPDSATRSASGSSNATRPSQVLDLQNWYLTLPTGDAGTPDTVRQPALSKYSSPFFQLDPSRDGVVLTSNAGGVTTAHSTYPRSELREMDGTKLASWSNNEGTHTLEVRQAVTQLPTAKPEVVTAQIHDTKSDVMEVRLEGQRLIGRYADGKQDFVIDPSYVLGTPYDLRMVSSRPGVAGTSRRAATCSPTPTEATRLTPSPRSCCTRSGSPMPRETGPDRHSLTVLVTWMGYDTD